MAQDSDMLQSTASITSSTPHNAVHTSQQSLPPSNPHSGDPPTHTSTPSNYTPTSDLRMNPPPLQRNIVTPGREMREMRESPVLSSGNVTRKPRQNLDERDHLLMVKHCYGQREHYKEGTKAQFWAGVSNAFQRDTGKVLAQMSATVGRLVESRRRQIADYESSLVSQKPGGELNDLLDQWMEFLKTEDGEAEAERMRQVDFRRKVEEARKEARRHTTTGNQQSNLDNLQDSQDIQESPEFKSTQQSQQTTPVPRQFNAPYPPMSGTTQFVPTPQQQCGDFVMMNGHQGSGDLNGYPSQKRKRLNESYTSREIQAQSDQQSQQQQSKWPSQQQSYINQQHTSHRNPMQMPVEPTRRVFVEGQLTKEDWKEIMGNEARLRILELKLEKIETLVVQNNKLLLQLIQGRNKDGERDSEDRVPSHLEEDFTRGYL